MSVSAAAEALCRDGMACLISADPDIRARAPALLARAVEIGHPIAANQLGAMAERGQGVPLDLSRAVALYEQAARAGLAIAQFNLGFLHHHGRGVPADAAQARYWYGHAAAQGEPTAQLNLAILLARGEGGPADPTGARALWARSAWSGQSEAAYNLGIVYAGGHDVDVDFGQAGYWFACAGRLGHPDGQAQIDRLRPEMTAAETADMASRLAADDARRAGARTF